MSIETLVATCLAIVALCGVLVLAVLYNQLAQANAALQRRINLSHVVEALETYRAVIGEWPANLPQLLGSGQLDLPAGMNARQIVLRWIPTNHAHQSLEVTYHEAGVIWPVRRVATIERRKPL